MSDSAVRAVTPRVMALVVIIGVALLIGLGALIYGVNVFVFETPQLVW